MAVRGLCWGDLFGIKEEEKEEEEKEKEKENFSVRDI